MFPQLHEASLGQQDAAAYAAGERAALSRAFQLVLPGQQALGALQAGLAALRASAAADTAALRTTQIDLAGAAATLQARAQRHQTRHQDLGLCHCMLAQFGHLQGLLQ